MVLQKMRICLRLNSKTAEANSPSAAVGTTKGISAKVSRTLSHLDFPRVISQANGTPARMSKACND